MAFGVDGSLLNLYSRNLLKKVLSQAHFSLFVKLLFVCRDMWGVGKAGHSPLVGVSSVTHPKQGDTSYIKTSVPIITTGTVAQCKSIVRTIWPSF